MIGKNEFLKPSSVINRMIYLDFPKKVDTVKSKLLILWSAHTEQDFYSLISNVSAFDYKRPQCIQKVPSGHLEAP
jgi:hypothetical protein